jgi:hypothetical protein
MENGLNFGKAIEAAKAGKEWQEQDGTEQECSHSSCITISCYYRRVAKIGESFVPYRAYWALKLLKKTASSLGKLFSR